VAKCKLKELLFRVGCVLCPFCDTCKALTAPHWPLKHVQLVSGLVPKMKSTPNACRMYVRGHNKTVTDIHTYKRKPNAQHDYLPHAKALGNYP